MKLQPLFKDIADAIREKEVTTDAIAASAFPKRIRSILGGGIARPLDWLTLPEPADNEIYLLVHIPDGLSTLLAFTVTCSGSYTVALGGIDSGGAFSPLSSSTVAGGETYETELFADTYGGLTDGGMKQAVVKINGTGILT